MKALDQLIVPVDGVLRPRGFVRRKAIWNRKADGVVDVVDIQLGKTDRNSVTVNCGVLDRAAYEILWNKPAPAFVQESDCTVRARIGELIDGHDRWWDLHETGVEHDIAALVSKHVIPFLDRMHDRAAMEEYLAGLRVGRRPYPPPVIYRAVLKHSLGDTHTACSILRELRSVTVEAWRVRIDQVERKIGCA